MGFRNHSFICLGTYFLLTSNAYADSWRLTQEVTTNTSTTLSQTSVNNSKQGINVVNLGSNGVITTARQRFSANNNDLTLSQSSSNASHQSVNYIAATQINDAIQSVNNIDTALLEQKGATNNSVQAINIAVTKGSGSHINKLNQTVSAKSVSFVGTGSGNIQAGNYIQADSVSSTAGNVVQNFTVSGNVTYSLAGSNNLQAGNVVIKNPGFASDGSITQNFSAGNVSATFSEADPNGSIKAANYFAEKI